MTVTQYYESAEMSNRTCTPVGLIAPMMIGVNPGSASPVLQIKSSNQERNKANCYFLIT